MLPFLVYRPFQYNKILKITQNSATIVQISVLLNIYKRTIVNSKHII